MNLSQHKKDIFRQAVINNQSNLVRDLLVQNPQLARIDLRSHEKQDHFTNGFALVEACKNVHIEVTKILLEHGANPDAPSINADDPPEFGIPLCLAVESKNYKLANLLLDFGASTEAFPYCDQPMIEVLYEQARLAGVTRDTIRKGYSRYLGEINMDEPHINASEVILLYHRVINLGVEPPISAIVRDQDKDLIEDLLRTCPMERTTKLSYPDGSIFECIVYLSSWYGYPDIVRSCMVICPELFSAEVSKYCIYRAIVSHNRDGTTNDYLTLISEQLDFLKSKNKWNWIKHEEPLYPFHVLAKEFLNKSTYGYKAPLTTVKDLIRLAQLFLDYGFDDYNILESKEGMTPIQIATERFQKYPSIKEYIDFLNNLVE